MPFNVTPDPKFLYLSPTHQEALAHLRYGIEQRKGFIVITGEVGCGKTILCRTLLSKLDPSIFETILIFNPQVDSTELLRGILGELGADNKLTSPIELINQLNESLLWHVAKGKEVLMIIDEAQNLTPEVLEEIRLLSNLETDDQKLFQIILMGQPELKQKLQDPKLRQLKQRILVYYDIAQLTKSETVKYIQHRISLASGNPNMPFFTPWALRKIYSFSKGIPRVINNVCDKALLSAYSRLSFEVCLKDVRRAVKDIRRL